VYPLAFSLKLLPLLLIISVLLVAPLVFSQGSLSITVSTDKAQYVQGETVRISGKVLDSQSNPVAGASVSVQVGEAPMMHFNLVYSDSSGSYLDSFILPISATPGQYNVYASASKPGYTSVLQHTQFTVLPQSTSTTSSASSSSSQSNGPPSLCFIATATYGSEVSPEVALLRNFRDAQVLRTSAGAGFMQAFNAFYYSFSPQVASFISSNGVVRAAMKVILYPLIGILFLSSKIFQISSVNGELAITISGTFAALGIGAVYFGPIAILSSRFVKTNARSRWSTVKWWILGSCLVSTLAIILGEESHSSLLLTSASVATVLSFLFLGAFSVQSFASLLGKRGIR
jgi:hypothetical protein